MHNVQLMHTMDLQFLEKKLKVSYTRSRGIRDNCNIFATHLPASWTNETLYEFFSKCGDILESRVLLDEIGQSRLCGFTRFNEATSAVKAIDQFNGYTPPGAYRPIKVRLAVKQVDHWKSKMVGPYSRQKATMLRRRRDWWNQSNDFESPGQKSSVKISQQTDVQDCDQPSNVRKSQCETPQAEIVKEVLEKISQEETKSTKIFICNFPTFFTSEHMEHVCKQYGNIVDIQLQKSLDGNGLGMGFVTFETQEGATKAKDALSECEFFGNTISVQYVNSPL